MMVVLVAPSRASNASHIVVFLDLFACIPVESRASSRGNNMKGSMPPRLDLGETFRGILQVNIGSM